MEFASSLDPDVVNQKIYSASGLALRAYRHSIVETQSIEQILVQKGICTADEFKEMRSYVERNSPSVRRLDAASTEMFEAVKGLQENIDAWSEFSGIFQKRMNGQELTDAEKQFATDMLKSKYKGDQKDD